MKASRADISRQTSLLIPLSATYQNLHLHIKNFDVFMKIEFLVYVIRLPLTHHVIYNVYHVPPLPIKIKDTNTMFNFLLPELEYLLMDVAKQYYARLRVDEIKECKQINTYHTFCKQNNPVQTTQLHEQYKVEMLQSIRNISTSRSQRTAETNQNIGTHLDDNEWLYVALEQTYLQSSALNKNLNI
jgi:hypothetical protein